MFGIQKSYVLFFRVSDNSAEIPPDSRIYQSDFSNESIRGTRQQIKENIRSFIPIFADKVKINDVPEHVLPIIGKR